MVEETEGVWDSFGDSDRTTTVVDCAATGSLAKSVCDAFGISLNSIDIGGSLKNIDIKQMDAMTVIKLSLLEESAETPSSNLYEAVVMPEGSVEFKRVGWNSVDLGDVYYTTQSFNYVEDSVGVMVTGAKPLIERHTPGFSSILDNKVIFDTQNMMSTCIKEDTKQYATVTFNDPHFDTQFNDGINNLYEIGLENAYDKVIGYAYKITPPQDLVSDDTSIVYGTQCEVPVLVADGDYLDIGELIRPPTTAEDLECWTGRGLEAESTAGIKVDNPLLSNLRFETVRGTTVDKFNGISGVYVIGVELDTCIGLPTSAAEAVKTPTENNTEIYIAVNNSVPKVFKLDNGVHYVTSYIETSPGEAKEIRITFANNARIFDMAPYGTKARFKTLPSALYSAGTFDGEATILPTGGTKGIWVKEIWATVSLDTPNFTITDPTGNALAIAEGLEVECAPIIITDEPAPIAFNGTEIDQKPGIIDHDPTTTQELQDTPYETTVKEINEGHGMTLSLSSLDSTGTQNLSSSLYSYINAGNSIDTTYVCGPDCNAEIGDKGRAGGIINNITYSYSDRGSYTISVNEGPTVLGGFEGITGAIYMKQTEEHSAGGTIVQDAGNHVDYKVQVDGIGVRDAINCCPHVLRVGDKVQVSIHNNPVED